MGRFLTIFLISVAAWAISVPTAQYDNYRNNSNNQETIISPVNVKAIQLLGAYNVDGPVWNQPLIAQDINGIDLLVACTLKDTCYGFNAGIPGSVPIWINHLATPRSNYYDINYGVLYQAPVGCLATPVIDLFKNVVYVLCGNATPAWVLYKLNLQTGAILNQITVAGSVPGTGDTSVNEPTTNGQLVFNPDRAMSRPALTLANGNIYLGFGSYDDGHPWHGWIMAYSANNLDQVGIICTTPNNYGGSVWLSGGGMAVDEQGNLYVPTGNGHAEYANSVLKLGPTLQVLGQYPPPDQASLESQDWDLTSGRPALVPGTNLLVFGAKDSNFYSIDTSCMCNVQILQVTTQGSGLINYGTYGGSVIGDGRVYIPATPGGAFVYSMVNGIWTLRGQSASFGYPGPSMTYTSNSGNGAILWAVTPAADAVTTGQPGILHAWDPNTFHDLWTSNIGTMVKFAAPTIANGMVYVPTFDGTIKVWGFPQASTSTTFGGNSSID